MKKLTYAILGTGALGGYYGACLQRSGLEVHYLLRSDYDHVRQHGLKIDSQDGDFTLPEVNAYNDPRDMPRCDVVLVCMKTTDNHQLPDLLPAVVKDDGVVVVMQNGLGVENQVADIVGPDRVMGCLCFLCANKIGPGHIHHIDYKAIRLGEHTADATPGGITDRLTQIAEDFKKANIPATACDDLILARWMKLVWNIPYNGLSVVLNSTTDRLMADPRTRTLVEELMREVQAGAATAGRAISEEHIQTMLTNTEKMAAYKPSMLLDFELGRPLEIEVMYAAPLRVADHHGLRLPRIEMLYQQLQFLDPKA